MGENEDAKVESEFLPVPMPSLDQLDALAAGLDRIATEAVTTQEVARRLEDLSAGPALPGESQYSATRRIPDALGGTRGAPRRRTDTTRRPTRRSPHHRPSGPTTPLLRLPRAHAIEPCAPGQQCAALPPRRRRGLGSIVEKSSRALAVRPIRLAGTDVVAETPRGPTCRARRLLPTATEQVTGRRGAGRRLSGCTVTRRAVVAKQPVSPTAGPAAGSTW